MNLFSGLEKFGIKATDSTDLYADEKSPHWRSGRGTPLRASDSAWTVLRGPAPAGTGQ